MIIGNLGRDPEMRYMPDGKFELKYGYEPVDENKAPPAAKAKKKQ